MVEVALVEDQEEGLANKAQKAFFLAFIFLKNRKKSHFKMELNKCIARHFGAIARRKSRCYNPICTSRKKHYIYLLRLEVNFACEQSILFSLFSANSHCDTMCHL